MTKVTNIPMAIASQRHETSNKDKVAVATIAYKANGRKRTTKVHNFLSNKPNASERRLGKLASALGGKDATYTVAWQASAPKGAIDLRPAGREGLKASEVKTMILGESK